MTSPQHDCAQVERCVVVAHPHAGQVLQSFGHRRRRRGGVEDSLQRPPR